MKKVLTASVLALSLASVASFAVAGNSSPKAEAYAASNASSASSNLIAGSQAQAQSQSSALQRVVEIVQTAAGSLGQNVGGPLDAAPNFDNKGNLSSPLEIYALTNLLSQPQISAFDKAIIDRIANENKKAGHKVMAYEHGNNNSHDIIVIYIASPDQGNKIIGYAIGQNRGNKGSSISVTQAVVGKHIVEQLTGPGQNGRGNTAPVGLIAGEKH